MRPWPLAVVPFLAGCVTAWQDSGRFEPGDAFKRWLLPGWGATVVAVEGELRDERNAVVGTVRARRTVSSGGAYTIGAWRGVFGSVADDIVSELRSKIARSE